MKIQPAESACGTIRGDFCIEGERSIERNRTLGISSIK